MLKKTEKADRLEAEDMVVVIIIVLQRWQEQVLTDLDETLVRNVSTTLLEQNEAQVQRSFRSKLLFEADLLKNAMKQDGLLEHRLQHDYVISFSVLLKLTELFIQLLPVLLFKLDPLDLFWFIIFLIFFHVRVQQISLLQRLPNVTDNLQHITRELSAHIHGVVARQQALGDHHSHLTCIV